jgi:uncharacterized protein (DUF302 family)
MFIMEMTMHKIRIALTLLLLTCSCHAALAESKPSPFAFSEVKVQIARVEIKAGVSFDEAVESLKLRANQQNLKFVGANQLYKEIEALTGKPSKRIEIFNFCDGLTAQKMIAANPLFIAFMPCRIALVEDVQGKRWVIAMMMDAEMIRVLPDDTRKDAERILGAMKDIMLAASTGDL